MLVQALATEKPTPSCMVCGTAQLQLQINTTSTTLAQFINKVGSLRTGCKIIWLGGLPLARDISRLPTALLDSRSCSYSHVAVLRFGSAAGMSLANIILEVRSADHQQVLWLGRCPLVRETKRLPTACQTACCAAAVVWQCCRGPPGAFTKKSIKGRQPVLSLWD